VQQSIESRTKILLHTDGREQYNLFSKHIKSSKNTGRTKGYLNQLPYHESEIAFLQKLLLLQYKMEPKLRNEAIRDSMSNINDNNTH